MTANTVFLRLAGPMQAWGTESRLQLRRSDGYPSKSGVIGLILCAKGISREAALPEIQQLSHLLMGVRIDQPGVMDWDYHTAGAKVGIRQAKGGIKLTASTKEPETLLSRRQYLCDASFLVALQGDPAVIHAVALALQDPVWPFFLGRKCCIPAEPVFAGIGFHQDVQTALASQPCVADGFFAPGERVDLAAYVEHSPGAHPPPDARLVYDVPRTLKNPSHTARWIVPARVSAPLGSVPSLRQPSVRRSVNYASDQWRQVRLERLALDSGLCVFCKSPAEDVHHVTYERAGKERVEDLRSLCKICHDACTQLEYGDGMHRHRVDPADARWREPLLKQIHRLLAERRMSRRASSADVIRRNLSSDTPATERP